MAAAGMNRFVATMAFCEAPFDGTLAPAVPAVHEDKHNGAASAVEVASALMGAAKEYFSFGTASEQQQGTDSVSAFFDAVALEQ